VSGRVTRIEREHNWIKYIEVRLEKVISVLQNTCECERPHIEFNIKRFYQNLYEYKIRGIIQKSDVTLIII